MPKIKLQFIFYAMETFITLTVFLMDTLNHFVILFFNKIKGFMLIAHQLLKKLLPDHYEIIPSDRYLI
jgi:hypothetical protein